MRFCEPASSSSDTGMLFWSGRDIPVTTTVPPLRMAENAWPTCSPVTRSIVRMALSAPWPLVTDLA